LEEKIMKKLVIAALTLTGTALTAAPTQYSCSNVGGTEEWTIYVDLKKKEAGFFDNDNTATVPYKKVLFTETLPPQTIWTFEGKDTGGGTGERLRITFNQTRLTGTVTFNPGTRKERTLKSLDGCKATRFQ
jgi:hypothetical protein